MIVAVALVVPTAAAAEIPHSELALGGISIDLTEQEVQARLGTPEAITEELDHLNRHLQYPHLQVSFSGPVMGRLHSRSPHACTPARLCPGDPLDRAVALYGAPTVTQRETGAVWEYHTGFPCWLQVVPERDRVGALAVVCEP